MTNNPFNRSLDWALQGKYVRVSDGGNTYEGWLERVHHDRGSVILHDATTDEGEQFGSVFIRSPGRVSVLRPRKRIEYRRLDQLTPFSEHPRDFEPKDRVIRSCYRNQYAGSFPVIRESGEIINGHKRVEAAKIAGLEHHPVEVVNVTDEQARELYRVAHRGHEHEHTEDTDDEETDSTGDTDGDDGDDGDGINLAGGDPDTPIGSKTEELRGEGDGESEE